MKQEQIENRSSKIFHWEGASILGRFILGHFIKLIHNTQKTVLPIVILELIHREPDLDQL